jgi:hypothetical protein
MAVPKKARGGDGKFAPSIETAERDAEACRLRVRAMSFPEIAKTLGYADASHAAQAVARTLRATVEEPAAEVRKTELARLDDMYTAALAVLERMHVTVSQGRVVQHRVAGTGTWDPESRTWVGAEWVDLADDAPVLSAIDRLLKIQERRARLLGLDAPVKHEVRNVDAVDAEIEQLVARLAAGGQGPVAAEAPARTEAGGVPHSG